MEELVDQFGHLRGHGGREEEGLLALGQPLEDLLHVVDKAHIQHPVGLVQHEDLQLAEVQQLLLVEVDETAGGGHQNIHAPADGVHLGGLAHAAEDHRRAQAEVFAVSLDALLDLEGQFPGGGENEGPDGAQPTGMGGGKTLQNGGGKGAGLAGAGLGDAQHVPPRKGRRDGLFLDGRRGFIAQVGQRPQDGLDEAESLECHSADSFSI